MSHREPPPPRRGHYLGAAIFFTLLAVYASLMPFDLRDLRWEAAVERFRAIPYFHLSVRHRADWVANILLYLPIGFFWLGGMTVDRRCWWRTFFGGMVLVVLGAVMAVAVEFTQVWFAPRTVCQNDIVAEVIGTALGVLLWMLAGRSLTHWIRRFVRTAEPDSLVDFLIQAWVLGLVVYSLLPFDLIVDLSELVEKYHRGKIHIFPAATRVIDFRWYLNRVTDMAIFAPVGAFAAGVRMPDGAPRSRLRGLAIGSAIVSVVIVCQLFVYSQEVEGNDVLTHYLGVIVGVMGYRWWSKRPSRDESLGRIVGPFEKLFWPTAALVYGVILCASFWSPFQFGRTPEQIVERLNRFLSIPFVAYYHGSEFSAMKNIVSKTVLSIPLGMLCAISINRWAVRRVVRRLLFAVAILYCSALAVVIELGQAWLPPHISDISDTLIYIAGAILGMKIVLLFRKTDSSQPFGARAGLRKRLHAEE